MPYDQIDLSKVRTYPLGQRPNLVKLADLVRPAEPPPPFDNPEPPPVAHAIRQARHNGRPDARRYGILAARALTRWKLHIGGCSGDTLFYQIMLRAANAMLPIVNIT